MKLTLYCKLMLITSLITTLISCTLPPIPTPSTDTAIIELYTAPGRTLMAERLDKKRVNDGRFFVITEGTHSFVVRFQYDKSERGFSWNNSEEITCLMSFTQQFQMGKKYRLEARPTVTDGILILTQNQQNIPIQKSDVSCGPY